MTFPYYVERLLGKKNTISYTEYLAFYNANSASNYLTMYGRQGNYFYKLKPLTGNPGGTCYQMAFNSNDATIFGYVGNNVASNYNLLWKRIDNQFIQLSSIVDVLGIAFGIAFSPDGQYAVIGASTARISFFKRVGDAFVKLTDPTPNISGAGCAIAFNNNGIHVAVQVQANPALAIYSRNGDTFTRLTLGAATSFSTSGNTGIAWGDGTNYIAVGAYFSPFTPFVFYFNGTDVVALSVAGGPTGINNGVSLSPDGMYLAVAFQISPFFCIYKRSGSGASASYNLIASPSVMPVGAAQDCSFNFDGTLLAVSVTNATNIIVYSRSGDTFTKLPNVPLLYEAGSSPLAIQFGPRIAAPPEYTTTSLYTISTTAIKSDADISNDGQRIVVINVATDNIHSRLFRSINGGSVFTEITNTNIINNVIPSINMYDDGTSIFATGWNCIPRSPDGGVTWYSTADGGLNGTYCQDMTSSGATMYAIKGGGSFSYLRIITGPFSSAVGTTKTVPAGVTAVAISTNAKFQYCNNGIYYTTNGTATTPTFTLGTNTAGVTYTDIDSSLDNTKLIATPDNGYPKYSIDSAVSWTDQTLWGSRAWLGCNISDDGLIAVCWTSSELYRTKDGGITVKKIALPAGTVLSKVGMSRNGLYIVFCSLSNSMVYVLSF